MSRRKAFEEHEHHKQKRNERFEKKIYGEIKEPIIPKNIIGIWDPPTYLQARKTSNTSAKMMNSGINLNLNYKCFYTGIECTPPPYNPLIGVNMDPRILPWIGTRDHLVPARRDVIGCPFEVSKYPTTLSWSSNVANITLGLAPLLVRLKIRQWMMTIPFSREDTSIEAGNNVRWLIIKLINEFRIHGRYPWSRKINGDWWYPDISVPFMDRMWKTELEFLNLSEEDRNIWIKKFNWQF